MQTTIQILANNNISTSCVWLPQGHLPNLVLLSTSQSIEPVLAGILVKARDHEHVDEWHGASMAALASA